MISYFKIKLASALDLKFLITSKLSIEKLSTFISAILASNLIYIGIYLVVQSEWYFTLQFLEMGWSTNEKAQAKRDKEKAEKQQKEQKRVQETENRKWKDDQTEKKQSGQRQKQQKREKELARKRQLREIAEQEERELQKINKKKQTFTQKKLTQGEIAKNIEERQKKQAKYQDLHQKVFFQDNPNKAEEDYQAARTVEEALRILDTEQEKHPEKRYKAAFDAYCTKRDIQIRFQYPKLKRSQRLQMMHKQFQKHADNPFNKNIVAYNDKTRKQAKKAKQQQKKQKQKEAGQQKIQQKREEDD